MGYIWNNFMLRAMVGSVNCKIGGQN